MTDTRMYKNFVGVKLTRSPFTFGGATTYHFLVDPSISMGANVSVGEYHIASPPQGVTGVTNDPVFVYRTPFSGNTIIDGPVQGNAVVKLSCVGATTEYVSIQKITVELYGLYADRSTHPITDGEKTIWVGNVSCYGNGDTTIMESSFIGVDFAFVLKRVKVPNDVLFCMKVRTYGLRSTTGSTGKYIKLYVGKDDADVRLALPLVE